jgi:hypothetical protein
VSSVLGEEKNFSRAALSPTLPERLIEQATPDQPPTAGTDRPQLLPDALLGSVP